MKTVINLAVEKASPDVREALLRSELLNAFYETTSAIPAQVGNESALFIEPSGPLTRTGGASIASYRIEAFGAAYEEFYKKANRSWSGGVDALSSSRSTISPSSYPVSMEYVEYLQTAKRNLESRVSELESALKEIRTYWPTVKKLLHEYKGATSRVECLVKDLTSKHGPRSALDMAKRLDVLDMPPDDSFDHGE